MGAMVDDGKPFDNYNPPSWDEFFMLKVYLTGYNGIPEGVEDREERFNRPEKYSYFEHAERNAIFTAARHGITTHDATLYTQALPCVDCARAIIQSGISKIYVHEQFYKLCERVQRDKWLGHDKITMEMFKEANVELIMLDLKLNVKAYLDGKVYTV
ncbi:unnamed protein product [Didymodactylos carnosus]|uniref:dCMP deaminase n=1 Tax=Didymodactylos carnosus TaxID=1234261 RepID=A0A814GEK5_9BILA|nr:unnamed protein product [Didymodactylos carnosus]CAF0995298.1 unnamed protein product [Didymodactylos carnosus]CAF3546444.1 unnamed protein product [Didymodactylos carnosus]CAF3766954.1 unnamed protein product [Didymodactylos carnosus]